MSENKFEIIRREDKKIEMINLDPEEEGTDTFLETIRHYARSRFVLICLAGLSVLTRHFKYQLPEYETITFETEMALRLFIDKELNGNAYGIAEDENDEDLVYEGIISDRPCMMFIRSQYKNHTCSQIEEIFVDVRTSQVQSRFKGTLNLEDAGSNIITYNSPLSSNPECFWDALVLKSMLPDFQLQDYSDIDPSFLTGSIPESPIFRFEDELKKKRKTQGNHKISYGQKVITHSIQQMLDKPYFPFTELHTLIPSLLGFFTFYTEIDPTPFNICKKISEYFVENNKIHPVDDITIARFAMLCLPLYNLYTQDPDTSSNVVQTYGLLSTEYDDFIKMAVNKVPHDRCPLATWFFTCLHGFSTKLVFSAVEICSAVYEMSNGKWDRIIEWAYIDAQMKWQYAISLMDAQNFESAYNQITTSGVLNLIKNVPLSAISHNELIKIHGRNGTYGNPRELKRLLFNWLIDNPGKNYQDYKQMLLDILKSERRNEKLSRNYANPTPNPSNSSNYYRNNNNY